MQCGLPTSCFNLLAESQKLKNRMNLSFEQTNDSIKNPVIIPGTSDITKGFPENLTKTAFEEQKFTFNLSCLLEEIIKSNESRQVHSKCRTNLLLSCKPFNLILKMNRRRQLTTMEYLLRGSLLSFLHLITFSESRNTRNSAPFVSLLRLSTSIGLKKDILRFFLHPRPFKDFSLLL
jgi:hypothetical protein